MLGPSSTPDVCVYLLHPGAAALECFDFVLNSILFPPQSRNFVKTLNYKTKIYQNFVKTLNYKTMIKLSIKTLILIIAFESHKKRALREKHAIKLLNIYGSMPCTTDVKFKNCQKLLDALLEKELNEKLHQTIMNHSILSIENAQIVRFQIRFP